MFYNELTRQSSLSSFSERKKLKSRRCAVVLVWFFFFLVNKNRSCKNCISLFSIHCQTKLGSTKLQESRSLSLVHTLKLKLHVSFFLNVPYFFILTMLTASTQLLSPLSWSYFFLTLLGAGAAYIQNNVFLGVNSDKVATLKGQMARWKRTTKREWRNN